MFRSMDLHQLIAGLYKKLQNKIENGNGGHVTVLFG